MFTAHAHEYGAALASVNGQAKLRQIN